MGILTTQNAKELEKELNKSLEALKKQNDSRYTVDISGNYPENPKYDRIKYDKLSDEELKKKVEAELAGETKSGRQKLYDNLDKTVSELSKSSEGLASGEAEQLKIIENAYKVLVSNIENTSLKKGVARSSIKGEQLKESGESKADKESQIKGETTAKLKAIEEQIDAVNHDIETALADFDIGMAKKLTTKVDGLKKEQLKLENDATKYNNDLTQKEKKANEDRIKNMTADEKKRKEEMSELRAKEDKYEKEYNDYVGEKKENYTSRYELALKFYSEANDKKVALALVKANPALENYLGIYYRKLLRTLGG